MELAGLRETCVAVASSAAPILLLGRYRLTLRELTEAPLRRRILQFVEARPGISIGEVKDQLGIGWGRIAHHLQKLRAAGMIEVTIVGRRSLIYPPRRLQEMHARQRTHLSSLTAQRIAHAILDEPGHSVKSLQLRLGESQRVVYYHVKNLVDAELVTSRSPTRRVDLQAGPNLATVLAEVEASRTTLET